MSNITMQLSMGVHKLIMTLVYLTLFLLLCFAYKLYVFEHFEYYGFGWSLNEYKVAEAVLAVWVAALLLPVRFIKPSDFLVHVQFLFPILPMLVMYACVDYPRIYMFFILLAFAVVCIIRCVKLTGIILFSVSWKRIGILLLALSMLCMVIMLVVGGLAFLNFDLSKVYEFRREAADNLPSLFAYISPLVTKVFLPMAMVVFIYLRQWWLAAICFAGSIFMFGLTSHKSVLLFPFAVLMIYLLLSKIKVMLPLLLTYGFGAILALSASFISEHQMFQSMLLQRLYFLPALINFQYYEFFSTMPFVEWSINKFTFDLIPYPYDLSPSSLIGREYYGSADTSANTGWIGSGYMNFGYTGMMIYAVVHGFILSILDRISVKVNKALVVAAFFPAYSTMALSADLPITLLTHGMLASIIVLMLLYSSANGLRVEKGSDRSLQS